MDAKTEEKEETTKRTIFLVSVDAATEKKIKLNFEVWLGRF